MQNAWSPVYAGGTWPRKSWLKALCKCRSGQRLRVILNNISSEQFDVWFDNTTPIVGAHPDSVISPCPKHIKKVIKAQKPDIIIAFGQQAQLALLDLNVKIDIVTKHPANRTLKNIEYLEIAKKLQEL